MAFGFIKWNDSKTDTVAYSKQKVFNDFIYDVGPRFSPIKKRDLDKAKTVVDFISNDPAQEIVSYTSVEIIVIKNDQESDIRVSGDSEELNEAQLKMLKSFDYSTNIKIRADFLEKNEITGKLEYSYTTPHLTVVPEKQALYVDGKDALMKFLREESKTSRADVVPENLQPAKLLFTVTKNGTIENVRLDRTSNYKSVDDKMIELITTAPGKWQAAENAKGEKVDQELVVSFGLMGC
jgi:hypothetical protein